jgi:energy-coupling factor transport system substrate-specific component
MTTDSKAGPRKRAQRLPLSYVVAIIPVAAALNIVGGYIAKTLQLPIFLDMIGTMVTAVVLGPWWGALVGAVTNIVGSFISGPIGLPFAVVNVAGGLVWGYAHRAGWMKNTGGFFATQLLVALVSSMFAVPIYIFIFGGATGHFSDLMTAAFVGMGANLITSVFSSNILVSLADKIIAGYVGLAIIDALPENLTEGNKLPKSEGLAKIIGPVIGVVIGVAVMLIFNVMSN